MKYAIEVQDLVKRYPNSEKNAVDGISFTVTPGEFFGFLGPNGAGKSTTINMLVNLIKPTSGVVKIAGFDVQHQPDEVYKRVGFAMQEIGLDETATAREMMQLHARLYHLPTENMDKKINDLLEMVELLPVADKYTSTYSGGMKRRFDLALSLIHEPKVLFLDEPTVGLDPHARQLIWKHLKELNKKGMTILLTTHFMEEAEQLCDRIAIVDQGKMVTEGTPKELMKEHKADSIEEVFLKVTGHSLGADEINQHAQDPFSRALPK
ncbi:MAG TPA: ATP-binding cassette domain-containing protein [Patescibacteria group bacterium]